MRQLILTKNTRTIAFTSFENRACLEIFPTLLSENGYNGLHFRNILNCHYYSKDKFHKFE